MGLLTSCQPSTFRMLIWPEASSALAQHAAVSADGSRCAPSGLRRLRCPSPNCDQRKTRSRISAANSVQVRCSRSQISRKKFKPHHSKLKPHHSVCGATQRSLARPPEDSNNRHCHHLQTISLSADVFLDGGEGYDELPSCYRPFVDMRETDWRGHRLFGIERSSETTGKTGADRIASSASPPMRCSKHNRSTSTGSPSGARGAASRKACLIKANSSAIAPSKPPNSALID